MECKATIWMCWILSTTCIDLTRMECKVNVPEEAGGDPACIDLTRMECKYKCSDTEPACMLV